LEFVLAFDGHMPWIFYGWFIFSALFIGAYFVCVWIAARKPDKP
jgi:hypothetical protein